MSKQVDVLAVMEDSAHELNTACCAAERRMLLDARDAVRELIEANVAFSAATDAMMKSPNDKNGNSTVALWHVANDRRSAALARCNGGAA